MDGGAEAAPGGRPVEQHDRLLVERGRGRDLQEHARRREFPHHVGAVVERHGTEIAAIGVQVGVEQVDLAHAGRAVDAIAQATDRSGVAARARQVLHLDQLAERFFEEAVGGGEDGAGRAVQLAADLVDREHIGQQQRRRERGQADDDQAQDQQCAPHLAFWSTAGPHGAPLT